MSRLDEVERQLSQALRAFRQNPTPPLAASIKRLAGVIKRESGPVSTKLRNNMKPILLDLSVLSNRHAVEAALAVVNGRYTKRTFVYYHQIANEIGRLESELSIQLRLPRGVWNGVSAVSDSLVGGSKRSKAVGTRILIKRINGRWFMTAIERSTEATEARNIVYLPKHLADRTMAEHRQRFEVLGE